MATFSDRLLELIGEESKNGFARRVGVGEASLRQYLAGSQPGLDKVVQIAKATGVYINWLATGEGPRDSTPSVRQTPGTQPEQTGTVMLQLADPTALEANALVLVPHLDVQASAGPGSEGGAAKPLGMLAFAESYLRDIGVNPRFAHVIQVSGLSMYPTLNHEDLVLVDTSIDHVRDEALYAVVYGNLVLIKRVRLALDGSVILSSDNKAEGHSDLLIKPADLGELHIAGRVCGRVSRM